MYVRVPLTPQIFAELHGADRLAAARTCKRWHDLVWATRNRVCLPPGVSLEAIAALRSLPMLRNVDAGGFAAALTMKCAACCV
jgi:hypothetical protein